jgi:hypothetical protein
LALKLRDSYVVDTAEMSVRSTSHIPPDILLILQTENPSNLEITSLIPFTALLLQTVPSTKGKGEEEPLLDDTGDERLAR